MVSPVLRHDNRQPVADHRRAGRALREEAPTVPLSRARSGRSPPGRPLPTQSQGEGTELVFARDVSVEPHPTVDMDGLASDKTAVITDEKQAGGGNFLDRSLPSQGNTGRVWRPSLIPVRDWPVRYQYSLVRPR